MKEVQFYKDLNHNYLIIKDHVDSGQKNYQDKMITDNKIKHLLECKIRYIDGERYFYYEISSKQNMKNMYMKRTMNYENLLSLFESIRGAFRELEKYLLDSRCIVLDPEYIYGNPETGEFYFIYYPDPKGENGKEKDLLSMAEFLVEKIDHKEEEAVSITYQIYERILDNKFIIASIMNLFDEVHIERNSEREGKTEKERIEQEGIKQEGLEREEKKAEEVPLQFTHFDQELKNPEYGDKWHIWVTGILSFICMGGAAGLFFLNYFYSFNGSERLLSIAGMIFLILLSASLFLYFVVQMIKYRKGFRYHEYEKRVEKEISEEKEPVSEKYTESKEISFKQEEYGNTVFMESAAKRKENKLYGVNKGNKYHISLEQLPCTIGKLAGSVDIVIRDNTISRIHARLTKQEDGIYVTDLNSTNGTFKNGVRLDPHESVPIEEGDELRFGRMSFCYR